ncbi:MAG: hypothetical protein KDD11_22880, partial [Acidobacteria bacterium]|nr:hypothetical protein [Acidobacteriota bacterium]
LDDLNDQNLVVHYRQFKHSLGEMFFHPRILLPIVETNLRLNRLIQQLYNQEERRIVTDYQRIFELEREVPVDGDMDRELTQFRSAVERFERQLESQELRLQDLASIRDRMRSLLPRLHQAGRDSGAVSTEREENSGLVSLPPDTEGDGASALAGSGYREELADTFDRLMEALAESNPTASPKSVALSRELFPFRLESREVIAYRRLHTEPDADQLLERFLLEAAALRMRINEDAEAIKGILDDTAITGQGPIFDRSRRTVRWGDSFLQQFTHLIDQQILSA